MRVDIEQSRRRKNIIIGVVMILLLVVAPVGYSLFSRDGGGVDGSVNEFGIDFVRDGGLWKIEFDGGIFGFQYLPSEVDDVPVSGIYDFEDYVGEVLYFVDVNEGASEILNNLGSYILRYQSACFQQAVTDNRSWVAGECEGDLPLKGCDNNLIIFEQGNETMVWRNESCVYIVGDGVRGADAFLYKALKIT